MTSIDTISTPVFITTGVNTVVGIPNETLYVRGLNERARIKDLKKDLHDLFSPFGQIHDIIAKKSLHMKGQAFIIFSDIISAERALSSLQGHILYKKPMDIRFARFKSNIIASKLGTLETEKEKRILDKEERKQQRISKRHLIQQYTQPATQTTIATLSQPTSDLYGLPNKILFIQNLPQADEPILKERLIGLFSVYQGFQEVRMIPTKRDIAFVEFDNETLANQARMSMDRFKITPLQEIRVTFAKK